ncbi:hypothetical protein EZV73_14690 [Acidaminobacter sp. JC074]|uniref:hypothetical protein n=1 Tax=Acidaminobacter sp. JC074 TaxID=2530199 RepID=UPI001F10D698|nr:hypothetical protein [Acidaminobacter sp. JC074]MCH4888840.1 hypothetical protein [Acidaminobacter sp. JC074]
MIEITKMADKYQEGLKKMMTMEGLDYKTVSLCLDTLFVVVDRLDVLGFGYYNSYDGEVYLDHLYIKKNERLNKLGDSLFRAILNSLQLQGITQIYMRQSDLYDGFLKAENIVFEEDRFAIDTMEFFNRKCRGSKEVKIH